MRGIVARYHKTCLRLIPLALIFAFIFGIIGPSTAQADPGWYNLSWQYRKKITINSSNVTATLTNFPVLISLASDASLSSHARSDGYDILFTAADETTKLSHEIESYNGTTGKLVAWVKIPTLSSVTNTDIYMYYGNAGASNQQNKTAVWDTDFKVVDHLNQTAGGANSTNDSTAYGNNGTPYNNPTFGVNGQMDGAISFNKTLNQYIQLPASNTILNADNFTLEDWFVTTTNHPAYGVGNMEGRLVNLHRGATVGSAVSLYVELNKVGMFYHNGTTSFQLTYTVNYYDGVPHHLAATHSSSDNTYRLYYDGVQVASAIDTISGFGTYPAFIATHNGTERSYNGTIDEVRISKTVRSPDWIKTSYNNQSSPSSFFSLGPPQNVPVAPTVTTNAASLEQETTATLNGVLNNDGGEPCQYSFEWGTAPGVYTANISWTYSVTTGQTFSTNLIGLTKGQPYYYRAKVINSAGVVNGGEVHFLTKPDGPVVLNAAANGVAQIDLTWTKGTGADRTMVRGKLGSYPTSYTDGYEVYFNTSTSASDTGLSANTTYFYRAWSEVTGSQQWSNTFVSANATTNASLTVIGGKVFTVNKAMILAPWLLLAAGFSFVIFWLAQYLRKKALSRRTREKNL